MSASPPWCEDIPPGQPFPRQITQAIIGCSIMLVIIGPYWLNVRDGESGERRLDQPDDKAHIIPVLVDGASVPSPADLPSSIQSLSDRQAFRLAGDVVPREVDALIEQIGQGRLIPPRPVGQPPQGGAVSSGTQ